MKFTRGIVTMQTDQGERTDEALISGPFAIHQTRDVNWGRVRGRWTITHIPSGKCLFQNATSERAARAFCRDVAHLMDWSVERPVFPPEDSEARTALVMARALATPWDNAR